MASPSPSESSLVCPITLEVMRDPVVAADGHTYERDAIIKWFGSGSHKSPSTGALLASTALIPNHRVRAIIDESGLSPSNSTTGLIGSSSSGFLARMASSLRSVESTVSSASSMTPSASSMTPSASTPSTTTSTSDPGDSAEAASSTSDAHLPQLQPHLRELLRTTRFFDEYLEQRGQLEALLVFLHDAQLPLPGPLKTESMLLRLGSALLTRNRTADARAALEEAAALPGASYVPRIWLCVSHVIQADFVSAVRLLRQLLVEVPEASPDYALLQGLLETANEDGEGASAKYAVGIARGHEAHRALAMGEEGASDPALRHYRTENLAWLYHLYSAETRDDALALEGIVAAQQLGFPRRVTLFRNMALTLMRLGRYDEALANINWSLELNDAEPLSWEHKANILKRLERPAEAIECWTRVIQLKPGCAEPLVSRATVWQDAQRGIQDCLRALQIDPDSLYAKAMLVALFLDTHQYREAQDYASQFIEGRTLPRGTPLSVNDVHIRRGRMHARLFLGDCIGAAEDLDELHARGHVTDAPYGEQRALLNALQRLWAPDSPLLPNEQIALRSVLSMGKKGTWMSALPERMEFADEATGTAIGLVFVLGKQHLDLDALVATKPRVAPMITALLAQSTNGRVRVRNMLVRLSPLLM